MNDKDREMKEVPFRLAFDETNLVRCHFLFSFFILSFMSMNIPRLKTMLLELP